MILLFSLAMYLIHFKFVGIIKFKDMHNIHYLGLSGEHRCPLGYLFGKGGGFGTVILAIFLGVGSFQHSPESFRSKSTGTTRVFPVLQKREILPVISSNVP